MSICAGVVVTVALQEVDNAPDTQACAQSDNESLQNTNCAVEKCHKLNPPKNVFDFGFYVVISISYTSKRSVGFTTARCFFMYRSMSKTFLGSASAVYL